MINIFSFEPSRNAVDESGLTPLMVAARSGSKHITTAVLVAGAKLDLGMELATGRNIFHLAAETSASIIGQRPWVLF
jgi:ankyrin repeat protein